VGTGDEQRPLNPTKTNKNTITERERDDTEDKKEHRHRTTDSKIYMLEETFASVFSLS
jgi:hypothetical protein